MDPPNEDKNNPSNSRDGFESQLQINIGPNGGTVSTIRKRDPNFSLNQMNIDLIAAQNERKKKLHNCLISEESRLSKLNAEISLLRKRLQPIPNVSLERLKNDNQRLRLECDLMANQVDLQDDLNVPLGEISEEFYAEIKTGQDANTLFENSESKKGRLPAGSKFRNQPPPRPPPPKNLSNELPVNNGDWVCSICTFLNHRDLGECEQCSMIRVKSNPSSPVYQQP